MACSGSAETKLAKRRSREIQRELNKDFANFKQELKLLLLGTGESGKSTIIKQMKILHASGFSEQELQEYKPLVFRNMLRSAKALLDATELLGVALANSERANDLWQLCDLDDTAYNELSAEEAELYRLVWADAGIQAVYKRANEFQLSDSTAYFFGRLDAISAPGYVPDLQDVLRARQATTGIHEFFFEMDKAVFRMLDVGGQRSERRKWIHCFEGITSILFIVASSEYDQTLVEDETNRMEESIALFAQIIDYDFFRNASFVLFLNKKDLLEEKVKTSDIASYFPKYSGGLGNFDAAKEFILDLYLAQKPQDIDIFPHYVCATDTDNVDRVFNAAKTTIQRGRMREYNLI